MHADAPEPPHPSLASGLPRADAGPDRAEPSRRVLGVTRVGVLGLLVLAAANGLFLYLVPGRAELDYAWAIGTPINAAHRGRVSRGLRGHRAGRLQGAVMALAADPGRCRLGVLATTLLGATLIHRDRFLWHYTPTWGWLVVYAVVPMLVIVFWRLQEAGGEPAPSANPRLTGLRA